MFASAILRTHKLVPTSKSTWCWLLYYLQYYEELQRAGVQVTKHVYMALINAYAKFGQFEKAKQVIYYSFWKLFLKSKIVLTLKALCYYILEYLQVSNLFTEESQISLKYPYCDIISGIMYIYTSRNNIYEIAFVLMILKSFDVDIKFIFISNDKLYCSKEDYNKAKTLSRR